MDEPRYPTLGEFWKRLDVREVEEDLKQTLQDRTKREQGSVSRVYDEATVVAFAERILPGDVPPKALAVQLDESFDKQAGRADEKKGLMPRAELVPTGFQVIDDAASTRYGKRFVDLSGEQQDVLISAAEKGELKGPEGFDSTTWFKRVRESLVSAFGSDPRGMVQMGYPGPTYKPGHIWLKGGEIDARVKRKRGYLEL